MKSALLEAATEDFCIMEKRHVPDGEGGFVSRWQDGVSFTMSQIHDTTILAQQAEGEDTASTYKFYVARNIVLSYPDVVKRLSDEQTFQITSDSADDKTPGFSNLNLAKVTAKKWRIPE